MKRPALSERDVNLHTARVYLAEARARRASPRSHAIFLTWAGNARRRAMTAKPPTPSQPDLFGAQQ
jgi:hypothetical protein